MSTMAVGISVIFLLLTPFVWRRLVHTIERVGWMSGIIAAMIGVATWVFSDVPYLWRIVIFVVAIVILGATALWSRTQETENEQVDLRKKAVWDAIKKWVEMPITRFRDQEDTLPLAEKPPELAVEIEECLKRKYPSIWGNLQKLKQEYHGWKNEHVSDRFTENINGVPTIHIDMVHWYNESTCRRLVELHHQLAEQIKSEILEKYHTRLKR